MPKRESWLWYLGLVVFWWCVGWLIIWGVFQLIDAIEHTGWCLQVLPDGEVVITEEHIPWDTTEDEVYDYLATRAAEQRLTPTYAWPTALAPTWTPAPSPTPVPWEPYPAPARTDPRRTPKPKR